MSTSHHATALPVKGNNPKPKDICSDGPGPPPGGWIPGILALWTFISLHFGLVRLHFLAFWPCGPSFPCILTLWAFISLHFGLVGLHFLAFWPCGPSFPCILGFCAFISFHFGLVGLHFLLFWPFRGPPLGSPPTRRQKWPVCPTSLQWIYQRRDRLHFAAFSFLGFHFLAFWPCGPSFPCILALWAFISFHFGLFGVSFWAPPQVAKNGPFAQRAYNGFISAVTGSILQFLAFWAFISLHFGLVGLHFLAVWPCGPSFPCILAL